MASQSRVAAVALPALLGLSVLAIPSSAAAACNLKYSSTGAPFSDAELAQVRTNFFANIDIDGSGAVVAAPDHNTGPGGDYYFHWERDGALTMDAVMHTTSDWSEVQAKMEHYVQWVTKTQSQPSAHEGVDIRTEPKYTIPDGKPFMGGWCRPQNDGPGLRGRSLAEYGLALLGSNASGGAEAVRRALWTGEDSVLHGGLVKYDLDWVAENWQSNGCDLWEEIQSADFFWNRFVDRSSLHTGALLAEKMGDNATAAKYRGARDAIAATLMAHYQNGYVYEASNRQRDSSVIEAFNVGYLEDNMFGPLSREVLGTVVVLNDLFCKAYTINAKDGAAGVPGILYGRYEGDNYDGGNPWTLLTASLAQLVYRQAAAAKGAQIAPDVYEQLQEAYSIDSGLSGKELGDALLGVGDGIMLRLKRHAAPGLHFNEQINRDDGSMTSAKDLTWTYANVLKAMKARSDYVAAAQSDQSQILV